MELQSILSGVSVRQCLSPRSVNAPVYSRENLQVNQREFAIQIDDVGSFYARAGKQVEYSIVPGADPEWVQLYLEGQVLVALLHQRKVINFHASSIIHNKRGILILGETGAGKSSLTVSFALSGAGFLTDDLTPVIFSEGRPHIMSLYKDVKIRESTAQQLKIGHERLRNAETGTGKQYLSLKGAGVQDHPVHVILKIEAGDVSEPEFHEPSPAEKFSLLRSEVCMWEILAGMPETEAAYLQQLLKIVEQVKIIKLVRPAEIEIPVLHTAVRNYLGTAKG